MNDVYSTHGLCLFLGKGMSWLLLNYSHLTRLSVYQGECKRWCIFSLYPSLFPFSALFAYYYSILGCRSHFCFASLYLCSLLIYFLQKGCYLVKKKTKEKQMIVVRDTAPFLPAIATFIVV